jgi:pimeloyl-ACP methyl ester carboxylesterase
MQIQTFRTVSPFVRTGLLAGLLAVAVTAAGEPTGSRPDLADLVVPPGNFVSLETHRLYYRCAGRGTPVLVIDNGIGGAAIEWTPVQDALARTTRVCTYDRAGYGWSDTGPGPRTTERSVEELRALLRLAGEDGPYLMVGHSFGGFNSRYLAAHYPQEVAGIVLIESSHPEQLLTFAGQAHPARHGINLERVTAGADDVSPYVAAASFLNSRRKAIFAQMDELSHFADSATTVAAAGGVGETPLLVIARASTTGASAERDRLWREMQISLSTLSSRGEFVVARTASHDVHMADPEFVVRQLRAFVERVRAL